MLQWGNVGFFIQFFQNNSIIDPVSKSPAFLYFPQIPCYDIDRIFKLYPNNFS